MSYVNPQYSEATRALADLFGPEVTVSETQDGWLLKPNRESYSLDVSFDTLARASEICGTKDIRVAIDHEDGYYYSELTYDDGSTEACIVITRRDPS